MGATEAVIFKVPLRFEAQRRICSNANFPVLTGGGKNRRYVKFIMSKEIMR